ncbi:MAG: aminoacetone oxidase family FAD-binding enzyme [candidate division WOR-3 bacterium]
MNQDVIELVIIGGGAAGLACALTAARLGLRVLVLEKGPQCGRKLVLTGGKRCNFTHVATPREMAAKFSSPAGLVPLLKRFPYQRIRAFFEEIGIGSWVDEDGCVWPKELDASGVRDRLVSALISAGVVIRTGAQVVGLEPGWRVLLTDGSRVRTHNVVVATGGASYPDTGSSGDGLVLAQGLGLETVPWFPALASLEPKLDLSSLAGITQSDVVMELLVPGDEVHRARGHFIFAHRFISGSSVLNLCGHAARALMLGKPVSLRIDFQPELTHEALITLLNRARLERPRAQVATVLSQLVARRLARLLCSLAGVDPCRIMANLTREEAKRVVHRLKAAELEIAGTEPLERATVTGGGVSLSEVDLTTMAARRFSGLYFSGEVLDVWAETGGYNLHFAFASGMAAAESVALASGGRRSSAGS